jgi:hypothetical protein
MAESNPTAHTHSDSCDHDHGSDPGVSPFVPVLFLVVAVLVWAGFQTTQLMKEKETLETIHTNQASTLDQAVKVRNQLDSIAKKTTELAGKGNAGAKLLVDELQKRGVVINATAGPATPPE